MLQPPDAMVENLLNPHPKHLFIDNFVSFSFETLLKEDLTLYESEEEVVEVVGDLGGR